MSKTILSNSAAHIDFNKEVAGLMNDNAHAMGRELKLAVAIHNAPATFSVANLLGGVGAKSKSLALRNALLVHSEAFKTQCGKADLLKKAALQKSAKGYAAKVDHEAANRVVVAAISMFERALTCSYFMLLGGAIVSKVTEKAVTLQFTKSVTVGDATYEMGQSDLFSRKDVYEAGRKLVTTRGIVAAKTTSKKAKGVDTKAATSASTVAGELAKVIGSLGKEATDEFAASATSDALFASMARKLFAADGVINVSDIIDRLRKSDAMKGVSINIDVAAPVTRKQKAA